jgi:membrane-bound serine protease (ClpP class)
VAPEAARAATDGRREAVLGEFTGLLDLLRALFRLFGLDESAMMPAIALVIVFFAIAVPVGLLAQSRSVRSGQEGMVGLAGKAVTDLDPEGRVFVHSEYWNAKADEVIPAGTGVVVVSVDGMTLHVRRSS